MSNFYLLENSSEPNSLAIAKSKKLLKISNQQFFFSHNENQ